MYASASVPPPTVRYATYQAVPTTPTPTVAITYRRASRVTARQ
jgi:hypothetical protein